jgi:NADH dehydrogenase FAD-containing subunit
LLAFERAERLAALGHATPEVIQPLLTFVRVGGGTVGVEMASTLAEMSSVALARDFRYIDPRSTQILLYEAASRVLPNLSIPDHPEVFAIGDTAHVVATSPNLLGLEAKELRN